MELYNEVTRRVAQKDGVLLIDLARELPRNSASYYDYLHYTEPGAAAVAGIVDRHLAPVLAARYPAFKKSADSLGSIGRGEGGRSCWRRASPVKSPWPPLPI